MSKIPTDRDRNIRIPNSVGILEKSKATPAKPKSLLQLGDSPAKARCTFVFADVGQDARAVPHASVADESAR